MSRPRRKPQLQHFSRSGAVDLDLASKCIKILLYYFLTQSIRADPNELPVIGHANHFRRASISKNASRLDQQISDCKTTHGYGGLLVAHVAPVEGATDPPRDGASTQGSGSRRKIDGGALAAGKRCDGCTATGRRGGAMEGGAEGGTSAHRRSEVCWFVWICLTSSGSTPTWHLAEPPLLALPEHLIQEDLGTMPTCFVCAQALLDGGGHPDGRCPHWLCSECRGENHGDDGHSFEFIVS